MSRSQLEIKFINLWRLLYPEIKLESEVLLIPGRKYRVDFVHLLSKTVIEIQGGTWQRGAHSTGKGLKRDYEKGNLLAMQGFSVFQLSADMITRAWVRAIASYIKSKLWQLEP